MLEQELDKLFGLIPEAANLQPAIITMNRGTIIEADHVRKIRNTLYVGIGYDPSAPARKVGRKKSARGYMARNLNRLPDFVQSFYTDFEYNMITGNPGEMFEYEKPGAVNSERYKRLREMNAPGIILRNELYAKVWMGPGGYNAHKQLNLRRLFKKILTININNIASIEYK